MSQMSVMTYSNGDKLFEQGEFFNHCFVIDSGQCKIEVLDYFRSKPGGFNKNMVSVDDLETRYGIVGAWTDQKKVKSVKIMDDVDRTIMLGVGTVVVGPLWAKAGLSDGWEWGPSKKERLAPSTPLSAKSEKEKMGYVSPFSLIANGSVKVSYFTLGLFESKIGNPAEIFKSSAFVPHESLDHTEINTVRDPLSIPKPAVPGLVWCPRVFNDGTFANINILSHVSLGYVALGETQVTTEYPNKEVYFLKFVNKHKAWKKHQVGSSACIFSYLIISYVCM